MKVAFAGSPASAVPVLQYLAQHQELVAVLTKPDAPVGRKKIVTPNPVAVAAESLGLPLIKTNRPTIREVAELKSLGAEVVIVVAFGALIPEEVLTYGPKFINIHFSLLPELRGAAPVQTAILGGLPETGITVFELDKGMDTGPILIQKRLKLAGTETTLSLLDDLTQLSLVALGEIFAEWPQAIPQRGNPTHAPKLHKKDGEVSPEDSIVEIDKKLRALSHEPGVFIQTNLGAIRILEARLAQANNCGSNGHLLMFENRNGDILLCAGSSGPTLSLLRLQPPGKQSMHAEDWWRGVRSELTIE